MISTELSYPFVVNNAEQHLTTVFAPVATSTLPCTAQYLSIGLNSGNVTLSTAPTIATPVLPTVNAGFYSQRLVIYNSSLSNGTLYLPDHTQVANELYLDQPLVGIAPSTCIELVYFLDLGAWYQVSRASRSDVPLIYAVTLVTTPTTGTNTLTVAQYTNSIIRLAFAMTGACTIVLPGPSSTPAVNLVGRYEIDLSALTGISGTNTLTFKCGPSGSATTAMTALPASPVTKVSIVTNASGSGSIALGY